MLLFGRLKSSNDPFCMNISWHGLSCFELNIKTPHGDVIVVTDPYESSTGLRQRSLSAQLVLVSHEGADAGAVSSVEGKPFIVRIPGEYEAKDIFVYGIATPPNLPLEKRGGLQEHIVFRIEAEDMRLAHLGSLNRLLTDAELAQLQDIDILFVPVGGLAHRQDGAMAEAGRVLSPKLAAEVVNQIEPRIVIPMTFLVDGLKESLEPVDAFLKAMGVPKPEEMAKYKMLKKDLPQEEMKVIVLTRD